MAARKPDKTRAEASLLERLEQARVALREEGVVKLTAVGSTAQRVDLVAQLVAEGFELSKSALRRPLKAQLKATLAQGAFIPLKSVGSHVAGASLTEAKKAALALVAAGEAKLVLRGTAEILVPPSAAVLSRPELTRLASFAKTLAKTSTSKSGVTMLHDDFIEALANIVPSAAGLRGSGRTAGAKDADKNERDIQLNAVLLAVDEARDPSTGLSFIPKVVYNLGSIVSLDDARRALLEAAARGLLELRPEGGIQRLSEEELAVCPPGPQGTRLSWARRMLAAPTE